MSDQTLGVLGEPPVEGQPQEPAALQQPQPTTDDSKWAEMEQRLLDKLNNSLQKRLDGHENRLKKEYDQRIAKMESRYEALGLKMPDSEKLEIAKAVAADFEDGDTSSRPAQAGALDPQAQTVLNRAHQIAQKYGVQLDPQDAEYKAIKGDKFNPTEFFEFLESVEEAAKAKAARLAAERQQRAGPLGSAAPMSVQGLPSGNRLDQLTQELTALQKNPFAPGSRERRAAIEQELRQLRG